MSVSYKWAVKNIKCKKNDKDEDVVAEIYWSKVGKDSSTGAEGYFEGIVHADNIPVVEGKPSKFVAYNKLKESDVLNWVKKVVGSHESQIDLSIQKQIDEQNNVLIDTPLPWVKPEK
jgi:hypothetical protein